SCRDFPKERSSSASHGRRAHRLTKGCGSTASWNGSSWKSFRTRCKCAGPVSARRRCRPTPGPSKPPISSSTSSPATNGNGPQTVLREIPGAADLSTEQMLGQPVLRIAVKQEQLARYGISARTVLDIVESLGTKTLGNVVEGQLRFPLVVRLPENLRDNPNSI